MNRKSDRDISTLEGEIWKDVKGYEGLYKISNLGRIMAPEKYSKAGNKLKPKMLRSSPRGPGYLTGNGYLGLLLVKESKINFTIHRLVADAFVENPHGRKEVNHINGVKTDNRAANLEWCSRSENNQHAFDMGLKKGDKGDAHPRSKLTLSDILHIRTHEYNTHLADELALFYGVSRTHIRYIINRKTWTHV